VASDSLLPCQLWNLLIDDCDGGNNYLYDKSNVFQADLNTERTGQFQKFNFIMLVRSVATG
jgi:hypothetical protein